MNSIHFRLTLIFLFCIFFQNIFSQKVSKIWGSYNSYISRTGYKYYYFTASNNNIAVENNIEIYLLGVEDNIQVNIYLSNSKPSNSQNLGSFFVRQGKLAIPLSAVNSGIYSLQLTNLSNNSSIATENRILIIENIFDINYSSNDSIRNIPFSIFYHYNADCFPNSQNSSIENILSYFKNSFKKSWIKENNGWELCKGLYNNTIKTNDNVFDVFTIDWPMVRSFTNDVSYLYHGAIDYNMIISSDSMFLNSDMIKELNFDTNFINESKTFEYNLSHELLHTIQTSWVPIVRNSTELTARKWLIEGQARLLETVINNDPEFLYNGKNTAMLNKVVSNKRVNFYEENTKGFMDSVLVKQVPPKLKTGSYMFGWFWRHLYEHNFASTTPIANRMAFLRETMKTNTSSNLDSIKTHMDAAFRNANGKFKTFDEAIIDFAQRVVFYNKSWKDSTGALLNNWEDPNGTNFYNTELQII
jgi:hypothetical protein